MVILGEKYSLHLLWRLIFLRWSRLRCPANILGGEAPSSLADRFAINNFTSSATGSVKLFIPTRRAATSSKQIRLEDVILYVLKSSDSLWSTWFFGFRYQNIITAKRVLRYQKQSICITVYTGSVAFFIIRQILRKCNSVICKRKTVSSDK